MIYSDEVYFYLTLPKNKQNNRYWANSAQDYGIYLLTTRNFWFGVWFQPLGLFNHTFLKAPWTAPTTYKRSKPFLFREWTRLAITEKVTFSKTEQQRTRRQRFKPTWSAELDQKSPIRKSGLRGHRTWTHAISFCGNQKQKVLPCD